MNRLVCLRWSSTTQRKENFSREARVAPLRTQSQLQPAFLRSSAMISQYFTRSVVPRLLFGGQSGSGIAAANSLFSNNLFSMLGNDLARHGAKCNKDQRRYDDRIVQMPNDRNEVGY